MFLDQMAPTEMIRKGEGMFYCSTCKRVVLVQRNSTEQESKGLASPVALP